MPPSSCQASWGAHAHSHAPRAKGARTWVWTPASPASAAGERRGALGTSRVQRSPGSFSQNRLLK